MKYNKELIEAFIRGRNARAKSASVKDGVYYSYDTPIARRDGNEVYVDGTYYSHTTSRQRNELILACISCGLKVIRLAHTLAVMR